MKLSRFFTGLAPALAIAALIGFAAPRPVAGDATRRRRAAGGGCARRRGRRAAPAAAAAAAPASAARLLGDGRCRSARPIRATPPGC